MKMREIIIKNQKEWDELDKNFKEPTRVIFQDAKINELIESYDNCRIVLKGSSRVGLMLDSSRVDSMYDSSRVDSMYDSSRVGYMDGSSSIWSMSGSSSIWSMSGSSSIGSMKGSSSIGSMKGSSRIDSMYDSSRVGLMLDSSRVDSMYDSSRVDSMYDSSRVGYMDGSSSIGSMKGSSRIEKAFDGVVIYTNDSNRVGFFDTGVSLKKIGVQSSFETMLKHKLLRADGITKAIKKVKQITESEKVYFLEDGTFCAQNGDTFAHAKTLKMSLFDLRFKLSDRDMSDYENLSTDDKLSLEDAITCYRAITGACSGGVEDFLERESINKNEFTIGEIIELTKDAYAGDTFAKFFKGE
jgi:hypothetical protein